MDAVKGWHDWKTAEGLDISVLNDAEHLAEYVLIVLKITQTAQVQDRLRWQVRGEHVHFSLTVHDAFYWPGGDQEEIEAADMPVLWQAWQDLKAIQEDNPCSCALVDLPILYTARKRGLLPQRDWLETHWGWHQDRVAWEPVRKLLVAQ